jgi:N-acetylmuramoyl-L-alanine amidase
MYIMKIRKLKSPNCNERKNSIKPEFLIMHYTATATGKEAEEDYFMNPAPAKNSPVSAHYMVDVDGTITSYVDEDRRAWHAGVSFWDGIEDLNSYSIGIEIVNPGHDYGYVPFPEKQMKAVVSLCKDIVVRHNISPDKVLGHSDIAPERKIDPGELFDWKGLASQGVGLWPEPLKEDFDKAADIAADEKLLKKKLVSYGYNPKVELKVLVREFQRHFQPEIFNSPEKVGRADMDTAARLNCLLRLKSAP